MTYLNEEEEKAFEIVKNITEDDLLDCWDYGEKEFKAIQIILNLTEKQRKEIDEKTTILFAGAEKVKQLEKEINELKCAITSQSKLISQDQKEIEKLKEKYSKLSHSAIEAVFSDYNNDVELLARRLLKQGLIKREDNYYINPDYDEFNNLEKREVGEVYE